MVPAGVFVVAAMPAGQCAIHRNETLVVRADDLKRITKSDKVIVLADAGTRRIGLRGVRDGEGAAAMRITADVTRGKPHPLRRRVRIARALKRIGAAAADVAGRYELVEKEGVLIVNLGPARGRK